MGKRLRRFFVGIFTVSAISGGVFPVLAQENLVDMIPAEKTDSAAISYLTGEPAAKEDLQKRPIAVMMGNNAQGAPQSGISKAGVIYEAPVEGNMTRLMGIFENAACPEKIGSIRSCRDYYVFYANEFDSIYCHFGQAVYALPYLEEIDNLNGMELENSVYFRTSDRKAPHNAYTGGERIRQGIAGKNYRQTCLEDCKPHYIFKENGTENILPDGINATSIHLDNFTDNRPWFVYDPQTKKYLRNQFGEAHVDLETEEQLTCDNIILQYSDYQWYDANGYLNIDTNSGGRGKFITRGKAVDITWEKDMERGITRYYDAYGKEIQLNPGKTWVEIILSDTTDFITIQ